jgi:hypothetical protein
MKSVFLYFLAFSMKHLMTARSFTPGKPFCSTPLDTSTPITPSVTAASDTLSGVSPPVTVSIVEKEEDRLSVTYSS